MANLRCRQGDLARVIRAWNPALVGRIVLVGALHSIGESEWNVTLLGAPGMTLTKNRTRLRIGNRMLAHDSYLKPLRGDELLGYVNEREASHA